MQIVINDILNRDDLSNVHAALSQSRFVEGSATAGASGAEIKNNLQAENSPQIQNLRRLVHGKLSQNKLFQTSVRPRGFNLMFSRYTKGMYYGSHVDNPIMEGPLRSDVAFTLFLSDPDSYDGGELVLEGGVDTLIKLPAGSLFAYPCTSFHHVNVITRGERLAVVGWAMSLVRNTSQRELLFDLYTARELIFERDGKSKEFDLVAKSLANLQRMWME